MAQVCFTIPNDKVERVINALCGHYGLQANAQNARQVIIDFVRRTVVDWERKQDIEDAISGIVVRDDPGIS
jgi:poly-beta-hydroxyalkanoate depolymerase